MVDDLRRRSWIAAALALAVAALVGAQATDPLAALVTAKGKLGWSGIEIGMSLVQVERRLGGTLALDPRGARPVCTPFAAEAERDGLNLTLGFPSARPGAKLEAIWVQFEGYQVAASGADLAAALRRRLPEVTYLPSAVGLTEADDPRPTYLLAGESGLAVRLAPREGVLLARRECLD